MLPCLFALTISLSASVAAQSSPAIVCVAGQCLQGSSNITLGSKLFAQGITTTVQLLPGQYTSDTEPQLLHQMLTASSASLSPSPGFGVATSTLSLPLNVSLLPGFAAFPSKMFSGTASFTPIRSAPATNSSSLSAASLALSSNVWLSISSNNQRIILWDSVPDLAQLPSISGQISVFDVQSGSCSSPCSRSGICTTSGSCTCPTGFAGSSCEACASGFFGPSCQPCPSGCSPCDDGIGGSGRCLKTIPPGAPQNCNCLNGVCSSDGKCTCNDGWTSPATGQACSKCAPGFFLVNSVDCKACPLGCLRCADDTGDCSLCKQGFTLDSTGKKCNPVPSVLNSGTQCIDGTFNDGTQCSRCSSICKTCTGPDPSNCIVCAAGRSLLNNTCVTTDGDGVCAGSGLFANNNKNLCDTCGAKCTKCKIPNFNEFSVADLVQCSACLPGSVLSKGKCIDNCPSGTFVSPQDNSTCTACDTSCSTCAGSATFCLTCAGNQFAFNGKCVSSCPAGSVTTNGTNVCKSCHPDCASCSGSNFNQCTSCPADRPVPANGRCLATCAKSQFFDKASSSCQNCDASCSSCSGSGPSNCLACSGPTQTLQGGKCVDTKCLDSPGVIPGLGVCLSQLLTVTSGSGAPSPLPSVPSSPGNSRSRPLEWWQILLMALGCAFILLILVVLWRRRARKRRAKQTAIFASTKALDKPGWRGRLRRMADWLFGHTPAKRGSGAAVGLAAPPGEDSELIKLNKLRELEEERHHRELEKLLGAYEYSRAGSSRGSRSPSESDHRHDEDRRHSLLSAPSLYSQITGVSRRVPEPRQPIRRPTASSRLSSSTLGSSFYAARRSTPPPIPTDAELYAAAYREPELIEPLDRMGSKNPFRR